MKIVVVGCGLSGMTAARILKDRGHDVEIFETRDHIGGNCFDLKLYGTLVHMYGPHIFHTDDEEVWQFISKFSQFFNFEYRPIGNTYLGEISLPYSKKTVKELGRELSLEEIEKFIFKDYSEKQWGIPFKSLSKNIINRIPATENEENPTWFGSEKYQCLPKYGYTELFNNMIDGIKFNLNCDKNEWKKQKFDLLIYTGRVDEYFNNCFGKLHYRSLLFKHELSNEKLKNVVYNQCTAEIPFTRIYDNSYFSFKPESKTIITKEFPINCRENDIPFYPVQTEEVIKYRALIKKEKNVIFTGRLATHSYLDMWMTIKQALISIKNIN